MKLSKSLNVSNILANITLYFRLYKLLVKEEKNTPLINYAEKIYIFEKKK